MNKDLIITVVVGLGISAFFIGYIYYNKRNNLEIKKNIVINNKVKDTIDSFIEEIILDYCNDYKINFLALRYNVKELLDKSSYALKTKRIGTLSSILDTELVLEGNEYLKQYIYDNYGFDVKNDYQLEFIIEVSRVEGKVRAVQQLKSYLSKDDFDDLILELNKDKAQLIKNFG